MPRTALHAQCTPRRVPGAKRAQAEAEPGVSHVLRDQQMMTLPGVSRTGLHSLMRKQGLPFSKLGEGRGAALRFSEQSLQRWLVQHEQHARSCSPTTQVLTCGHK